jgi:hypothetical protein
MQKAFLAKDEEGSRGATLIRGRSRAQKLHRRTHRLWSAR